MNKLANTGITREVLLAMLATVTETLFTVSDIRKKVWRKSQPSIIAIQNQMEEKFISVMAVGPVANMPVMVAVA